MFYVSRPDQGHYQEKRTWTVIPPILHEPNFPTSILIPYIRQLSLKYQSSEPQIFIT